MEMMMTSWIESLHLPSIGHMVAFLAIAGLWKHYPRVDAFYPRPASKIVHVHASNPMFTSPSSRDSGIQQQQSPPPPARTLSDWETESCDSQSFSSESQSPSADQEHPPQHQQQEQEPSFLLKSQVPESTIAERRRFLVARNGNEEKALENLLKYTSWRNQYAVLQSQQEKKFMDIDDQDLYDWIVASQTALHANEEAKQGWQWLPQVVQSVPLPNGTLAVDSTNGTRILQMTPAKIDDQLCSLDTYSLAIALYMDRKFQRDSLEKMTLLMDLRPGEGWRNISAVRLLPFIKSIVGLMLTMFPERLAKSVLYPLPFAFSWVFRAVKAVIDPVTASKIVVVSGSAGIKSPLPLEQLSKHVSKDVVLSCEHERLASFTTTTC